VSQSSGSTVIITGASSGIGLATARVLAESGISVWNIDRVASSEFQTLVTDVSVLAEVSAAVGTIKMEVRQVAGVFANAGIVKTGSVETTSIEAVRDLFEVNFLGMVNIMKETFPLLRETKGSFVACTSDQTFTPKPMTAVYGSLKAAVSQLVRTSALEQGPYGVRVNAVAPGPIRTAMHHDVLERLSAKTRRSPEELEAEWSADLPLGRIGNPEEVAMLVKFLLSSDSSYISGAIIPIDGGLSAGQVRRT